MRKKVSFLLTLWLIILSGIVYDGIHVYADFAGTSGDRIHEEQSGPDEMEMPGENMADVSSQESDLEIETPHAAVMEVSTGTILYEKNADERVHPASVTKVMTILLIFEAIENGEICLTDEVVTSAHAKSMGGSQVFLEEGEKQTVETLLKCIIIASGNDAAVAMAEKICSTEEAFVERMNEKAAELGMVNTHFADCCGLTESGEHYTSAKDVAIMSGELLANYPEVTDYSDIWMEDITHETAQGNSIFTLTNTNKLLRAYDGCDGLKTGSTSYAKYCLSATAMRDGIRLVSVVLTAPDTKTRFSEAAQLLDYGFSKCSMYYDEEMPALPKIAVEGALQEAFTVCYDGEFSYLSTSGEDFSQIEKHLEWEKETAAPLEKGDTVGFCVYELNGKEIGRVSIVMAEAAQKAGYTDYLGQAWQKWMLYFSYIM
ncbi:MAG: D-alanyl-D-alanine carboxypeptidase [Clostridiales bacterium]|nr:D-alanyl-D-alanine carboxypeptidase [Clostridiales bacterium]